MNIAIQDDSVAELYEFRHAPSNWEADLVSYRADADAFVGPISNVPILKLIRLYDKINRYKRFCVFGLIFGVFTFALSIGLGLDGMLFWFGVAGGLFAYECCYVYYKLDRRLRSEWDRVDPGN